jgi:hypothetical protein
MHSRKVVSAVAAMAALLLAPAGASAFKHPSPSGRCRISINVAPPEITAGDPVVIFGQLHCRRPAQQANQTVKLYHHLIGSHSFGFTYVQSVNTDAHGFYEFSRADGVVETNRAWYVRAHGAQSASKRIKVAAQVSLSGPPTDTQLLTGPANKVTFTGSVSPADVGARVILERQNALTGSEWRRIDVGTVEQGGSFTIVHTFRFPGDANLRVLVRSQRRNVPSASGDVLEYEISQAQNPALTIVASQDPISFGQSVTITGVLAGPSAADRPVTLLARTDGQSFAPVAQATTDANGNYSFPAQSPMDSTFYRVTTANHIVCAGAEIPVRAPCAPQPAGAVVKSAVLYEGVKDILTAQVSATTVQAGQKLTFSGSVSPSHPGHVIYLERQDANGMDFHVVDVAQVNPDSTYAIVHEVYDAGTKVFRVYIPGGPENLGAASQPFTITVTPAPAATLVPEEVSNTSLPAEGSEGNGERGEGSLEKTERP